MGATREMVQLVVTIKKFEFSMTFKKKSLIFDLSFREVGFEIATDVK